VKLERPLWTLIHLTVLLTGGCALTYQVVWQRYLSRLAGSDSLATAVVLAVFLGGLSVGYLVCGRWSRRLRRPLWTYGILEIGIGGWALLFPWWFSIVERLTAGWSFAAPGWLVIQGTVGAILLVGPPTVWMGATVPMLTRGLVRDLERATGTHARLYAWNTLGAFVGTLLAGFALIQLYGLPGTLKRAAIVNLIVGGIWLVLDRWDIGRRLHDSRPTTTSPPIGVSIGERRLLWTLALLSGVYFMLFESLFVRILKLTIGASSYSFSLVVAVFIASIAVGSFWVARRPRVSLATAAFSLSIALLGLGLLFMTLDRWPYLAHVVRIGFSGSIEAMIFYYSLVFVVLTVVLIVPVAAMGAVPPILFDRLKGELEDLGSASGGLLAWNALGNLLGGLIGGYLLFAYLGIGEVFVVGLLLVALSVGLTIRWLSFRGRLLAIVALTLAVFVSVTFPYDPLRFASGTFRIRSPLDYSHDGASEFYRQFYESRSVLAYVDDPTGTFSVIENPRPEETLALRFPALAAALIEQLGSSGESRPRSVLVNGKSDSSTYFDRETLRLAAHIPALLVQEPRSAFVIGLGTGVTAAELTLHPGMKDVTVAEIAPAVVDFLPHFRAANRDLEHNDRVTIDVGDALRILRRSDSRWDIITSEPSNPWVTGVDQLFSRDFYRLVKSRLEDGGVFLQWIQRYATNEQIMALVMQTVRSEFPHVYLFRTASGDDLLLATETALTPARFAAVDDRMTHSTDLAASLADVGIDSAAALQALLDDDALAAALQREIPGIETLDHPRLHYLSGQAFFRGASIDEERALLGY